jgi:hypothetical protein
MVHDETDMTKRCIAVLGAALAFGATAAHPAEKHHNLHIVIETIDHSQQRYPTVGDWQIDKAGMLSYEPAASWLNLCKVQSLTKSLPQKPTSPNH